LVETSALRESLTDSTLAVEREIDSAIDRMKEDRALRE
jgi:hypothetical protein